MQQLLLGVDIGTTATKAVLVDLVGVIISQGRAEHPTIHLQAGFVEQDPATWWQSFCQAVRQACDGQNDLKIAGVVISAQAPTLIAVDEVGSTLGNAMIWMDRRSQPQADQLGQMISNISQLTGNRADPYYVASKIKWFKENEPEKFAKTKYFLQIPGYLNYKLTGKFSLDSAHASLLQLRNAANDAWSDDVMKAVGVASDKFPPIADVTTLLGEVLPNNESNLPAGTKVFYGTVDGCAAAVEAGVLDPGVVAEMTGTSTVLLMPTDGNIFNDAFIAIDHAIPGRQLRLGAMVSSGASVQWLQQKVLAEQQSLEQLSAQGKNVPAGCDGVIFLPYMMGERSPIWHTDARGVFFGLTLTTSAAVMYRAILEGTAFALLHNVEIARQSGVLVNEIRSVGGGSQIDLWNQIKADVLGIPISILDQSSGAALGDAYLAALAAGLITDIRKVLIDRIKIAKKFMPDLKVHQYYQKRYQIYRSIYENLKEDFDQSAKSALYAKE